jgi:hypothetical protein
MTKLGISSKNIVILIVIDRRHSDKYFNLKHNDELAINASREISHCNAHLVQSKRESHLCG